TEIRAISVNAEGVPSLVVTKVFTVEFPIEDAPSVTPSTGQYDDYQEIKILVPDGYVAFYTTDGSDPTTSETRIQYSGAFDMPEGSTILNVVLMNQKGRYSDVTKRNYELILSEE
ncbi:MAG: chitobiase/beta-hexosaminidase C-terminal domain-containing protein, partial [Tyzzerella sp.]|nr:chitobiase/beta-hexosaminidase C-terminal domain-containing protein [Tyzzerella sp.]